MGMAGVRSRHSTTRFRASIPMSVSTHSVGVTRTQAEREAEVARKRASMDSAAAAAMASALQSPVKTPLSGPETRAEGAAEGGAATAAAVTALPAPSAMETDLTPVTPVAAAFTSSVVDTGSGEIATPGSAAVEGEGGGEPSGKRRRRGSTSVNYAALNAQLEANVKSEH